MAKKFTQVEWTRQVHEQFIYYPPYKIKKFIQEAILILQGIVARGDMLAIEGVGRLIAVEKKPRFGVRNLSDPTQPAFTMPARKRVCFVAKKNFSSIKKYTLLKPEYKKYKFSDCLAELVNKIQDQALASSMLTIFIDAVNGLLSNDSKYTKVEIRGLLVFSQAVVKQRKAINPSTGQAILVKEKMKISFKQSKYFTDLYSS